MNNNDFLRSFRYALELDPNTLRSFFMEGGRELSLKQVAAMLKNEEEAGYLVLSDELLSALLDGLIATYRGRRENEPSRQKVTRLTNNQLLRALRIAFELRDMDIVALMDAAGREVSKTELSALFRREDHRNYQPCGDQFMRAFLRGLGLWHRKSGARSDS